MSKFTKILLGLATILPLVHMIFFFVAIFSFMFMEPDFSNAGGLMPPLFTILFPLHFLAMLLIMGLTVFYIINIFRNDRVEKDKKALWAVVIFMGNVFAMPVYWYLYIWREQQASASAAAYQQSLGGAAATQWANQGAARHREHEYVPPPQPPDWRG